MKRLLIALTLLCGVAQAEQVTNKTFTSFMNFGMRAMEVTVFHNGEVQIVVESAVLLYPDNEEVMNPKLTAQLQRLFEMKDLNSLIIKFPKGTCVQHQDNSDVFRCNTGTEGAKSVKIQAARVDYDGNIEKRSPKVVLTPWANVEVRHVQETMPEDTKELLRAHVDLALDEGNIGVRLTKSHISPPK